MNDSAAAKNGAEIVKTGIKLSLSSADVADRAVYEATKSSVKFKDTDYPTFYSFGIPAKNLDDVVYATPYAEYSDGTTLVGDEVAYSVLEYCYQMILVDAPAAAESGEISADKCAKLRKSLRSLLAYGANVQEYLGYETDNLPTDYCYIAAEDTEINSSSDAIFVHKSELPEAPIKEVTDSITELLDSGNSATKVSIQQETVTEYKNSDDPSHRDNIERASYTFEAKYYIPSGMSRSNTPVVITFNDSTGANYQGVIVATADGKLSIRSNVASTEFICGTADEGAFECNKWVTIRFVLYKEMAADRTNCGVKVWVDGKYAGSTEGDVMNNGTATNGVYSKATNGNNITYVTVKWGKVLANKTAYIDDVSLTEQIGASFSDAE